MLRHVTEPVADLADDRLGDGGALGNGGLRRDGVEFQEFPGDGCAIGRLGAEDPRHAAKLKEMSEKQARLDPAFYCKPEGVPRMGPPNQIVQTPGQAWDWLTSSFADRNRLRTENAELAEQLRERVKVLERIATEDRETKRLSAEIERLRGE